MLASQQADKALSQMATVQEKECWLVAKLISIAKKDVVINLLDLHINPDYEGFIQKCGESLSAQSLIG